MLELGKDRIWIWALIRGQVQAFLDALVQIGWQLNVFMIEDEGEFQEVIKSVLFQEIGVQYLLVELFEKQEEDSGQSVGIIIGQCLMVLPVLASQVALDQHIQGEWIVFLAVGYRWDHNQLYYSSIVVYTTTWFL